MASNSKMGKEIIHLSARELERGHYLYIGAKKAARLTGTPKVHPNMLSTIINIISPGESS